MQKLTTTIALISLILIAGCATSTDGIVEIGTDTYKVGNLGRFTDYSSSALKARLYQDAYKHCAAKNRLMVPINGAGQNPASATNAATELQFRCVARSEANLPSAPVPTL
jgi:hypothetical protein